MPDRKDILKALAKVINKFNMERLSWSNVPDFILAEVALNAVESYCDNFQRTKEWYGVHLEPALKYFEEGK